MLVTDSVFIEHLRHFLGDHVAIVLNGNERDFFSWLDHGLWSGSFRGLGGVFGVSLMRKVYTTQGMKRGAYSKASREERSG